MIRPKTTLMSSTEIGSLVLKNMETVTLKVKKSSSDSEKVTPGSMKKQQEVSLALMNTLETLSMGHSKNVTTSPEDKTGSNAPTKEENVTVQEFTKSDLERTVHGIIKSVQDPSTALTQTLEILW